MTTGPTPARNPEPATNTASVHIMCSARHKHRVTLPRYISMKDGGTRSSGSSLQNRRRRSMKMLVLILEVAAFVLFVLAGLGVPNPPRINFIGWGLALLTLAMLLGGPVVAPT